MSWQLLLQNRVCARWKPRALTPPGVRREADAATYREALHARLLDLTATTGAQALEVRLNHAAKVDAVLGKFLGFLGGGGGLCIKEGMLTIR